MYNLIISLISLPILPTNPFATHIQVFLFFGQVSSQEYLCVYGFDITPGTWQVHQWAQN